ncbi:DUF2092 domain-containing protein [Nitrobacter sp.]|uniref:DUF2092 domain-containing protein n=1 Tax=Nitrobacter sp. TaxID=29420 RepID=UPI0029CAB49F|nr:DUF2092 domain-containing protein [Nitrobacter sp.]
MSGDAARRRGAIVPPLRTFVGEYMKLVKSLSFLLPACVLAMTLFATSSHAQDADKIVRAMSDYLANAKTLSLTYDTDIEVITPDVQKLQFASSGQVLLNRPNQLRATRVGGYANVELVFDGNTLTMFGRNIDAVAQVQAKGSVDQLVQRLRDEFSIALPGADFLLSNSYDELMIGVRDLKHIGRGVIDGVECEHLAFRTEDADWQLWVEVGAKPIPRKYIITSKGVAAAPQYTLRVKEFRTNADLAADAFAFKVPASAKKVDITALSDLDEVPHGIIQGDKK